MITDGASEALSPEDLEFGDERLFETMARVVDRSAAGVVSELVEAVLRWTGPAGCSDDLTALVLKAL
jgi:serine phosphatase RsbU (regulator of sigma subunit)